MYDIKLLFPLVTVDVALFSVVENDLCVLLVRRSEEPQKGRWGLPGGVLKPDVDADLVCAARRVLMEKIGVTVPMLSEVRTFSGNNRDVRGWSISVLHYALLPQDQVNAVVKDRVDAIEWMKVASAGVTSIGNGSADGSGNGPQIGLAFDHADQIQAALGVLRKKVGEHALPLHLMPKRFTLRQLQVTCEAILGSPLDKAAFRRRIRGIPELVPLDDYLMGSQRPAQYFEAVEGFVF